MTTSEQPKIVSITPEQILDASGTRIKARVTLDGRQDARPANDLWDTRMVLPGGG